MKSQAQSEQSFRSLLQNLVVIISVFVLSGVALWIWFAPGEHSGWQEAKRDMELRRFNDSLLLARAEWMREGKPQQISLNISGSKQSIQMNSKGWPAVEQGCVELWQRLADAPSQLTGSIEGQTCLFRIEQKLWQEYNAETGQIRAKNAKFDL